VDTEVISIQVGTHDLIIEQYANVQTQVQAAILCENIDVPFWAVVWPSSIVSAAAMTLIPNLVGARVLELGGGVGTLALAAALCGAKQAVSTDIAPEAADFVRSNAERNNLDNVFALTMDWNQIPNDLGRFDVVVAADVLYADGMLRGLLRCLSKVLTQDGVAYIADPNRAMRGGFRGAAKLHGMVVEESGVPVEVIQRAGLSSFRGVTLYTVRRKPSILDM